VQHQNPHFSLPRLKVPTADIRSVCKLFGLYANKPVNVEFSFYKARRGLEELSR
jgi:hypothetical protein